MQMEFEYETMVQISRRTSDAALVGGGVARGVGGVSLVHILAICEGFKNHP